MTSSPDKKTPVYFVRLNTEISCLIFFYHQDGTIMKKTEIKIGGKIINTEIKEIKELFKKPVTFEDGKKRFLSFHSNLYKSEMSGVKGPTFEDLLWENLPETVARESVNSKGRTILYGIWHSTRIEDMTMNILVKRDDQIYKSGNFKEKIKAGIDHTGNSLSKDGILELSGQININALNNYRIEVGRRTQQTVRSLNFSDLKRKILPENIERIRLEGGVDDVPSANWLLDFWGNKTVEGILMMPAARHQIVHLNESFKAKKK